MMRRTILVVSTLVLLLASCGSDADEARDAEPTGTGQASASIPSPTASGTRAITLLSGEKPLPIYTIENGDYAGETGETQAMPDPGAGSPWGLIDGTTWVVLSGELGTKIRSRNHATGRWPSSKVYTDYVVTFRLPKGFTLPSLSVLVLCDDSAEVFLNKTSLGHQPTDLYRLTANNSGDPWRFTGEKASLFQPGVNTLRFRVMDLGGGTGLDYSATITYLPKKESG